MITVSPESRVRIAVDGPGPMFLGLSSAERNRRTAARAAAADPALAGTLRLPVDVAVTRGLFDALPREGTWQIRWHAVRPPLAWQAAASGIEPLRVVTAPEESVFDLSTAATRRRAAWQMLKRSGKKTDGWLSRHIHRKISRLFSYLLLQLGLTANHATFLTFGVGVVSAWLMAQTTHATMIAGALLFWFASVADGIDGEMARLSLTESPRGEQLDTVVDNATHILCFAGVLLGWWRQGIGEPGAALAIGVGIALPLIFYWCMRIARNASGGSVDMKLIEIGLFDAARESRGLALRAASGVFLLFRREAVALGFFLVSLVTGRRAVYPAVLAGGLVVVAVTLAAGGDAISAGIRRSLAATPAASPPA